MKESLFSQKNKKSADFKFAKQHENKLGETYLAKYVENFEAVHCKSFEIGVGISEDLTWGAHTAELVKKANTRLYFLRVLRKNYIPERLLVSFYRCTVESILTYCVCAWFSSCTEEKDPRNCEGYPADSWLPSPRS